MATNTNISNALLKQFEKHRIVFWYDDKQELRADYVALELDGIEKIEIANNELGVKYRILREQPDTKFLLYYEGAKPENINNWLLDIQLAHAEFRTGQTALWLAEMELGIEAVEVVETHGEFYKAAKRRTALKKLLAPLDTLGMIRLKMLAVCAGADARIDAVLESLLDELAGNKDEKIKLISRCGLDPYLWEQMKRCYGYVSETPGMKDFAIELFKSCYAMGTDGPVKLSSDALVFLKRWKDSRRYETAFEALSNEYALVLKVEQDLAGRDFRNLVELDYFEVIDRKVIRDLVGSVEERTISSGDCTLLVRQRRQSHWYSMFEHEYAAVDCAAQFFHALDSAQLSMDSLAEGVERYAVSWYRIDQLYRQFIYHVRRSGQTSLLGSLAGQVESHYSNNYLLKINDRWQQFVDEADQWAIPKVVPQNRFFNIWVKPFLKKKKKVFVIVSDALRYEIGEELLGLIRQEDRFEAKLDPMLSMLPSDTRLGMAALLPNSELSMGGKAGTDVFVDGSSSQGTENRSKILNAAEGWAGKAITAEALLAMPREGEEGYRALFSNHDVVYIYHDRIDSVGHKRASEDQSFEAAKSALKELVQMLRKLSTANVTNMLVTADHGFIYQNCALEESDYLGAEPSGDEIVDRDRRFILGKGLAEGSSFKKFSAADVGLTGDTEMLIPKSINRLRRQGASSRFVHGGASLQEVVVPVLQINKKRRSDLRLVEVDILRGGSSVITSGQLGVAFYQEQPVSDKVHPRTMRAGIYTEAGELISDSHELTFDLTSDNPRERELKVRFVLTRAADEANGQEVVLRLEEKESGTSHYVEYKSLPYTMRRSFASDFDF